MYNDTLHIGEYQIWQAIGGITEENSANGFEPYDVDGILVGKGRCGRVFGHGSDEEGPGGGLLYL